MIGPKNRLAAVMGFMARPPTPAVEPVVFDQMAGRRAMARAFLRSRKIYRVKGLYGSP
jgi:hypothetical protein